MGFPFKRKRRSKAPNRSAQNEQLARVMKELYQRIQLQKELEQQAYEHSEELYIQAKIERAKYLYLMKEARVRNLVGDLDSPKKARSHYVSKRTYEKDRLFIE